MKHILHLFKPQETEQIKNEDYLDILWLKNWHRQFEARKMRRVFDRSGIYESLVEMSDLMENYIKELIKEWEDVYDSKITEYKSKKS